MSINVRKNARGHRTVNFSPYGRLPLRDATKSVTVTLNQKHLRDGKKETPSACAIALALKESPDIFPGALLGLYVRKSFTLVAMRIGERQKAIRYAHSDETRRAINGFDANAKTSLKAGDEITLYAPVGTRKIGRSNGASNNGADLTPRKTTICTRRGIFVDPLHGKMAAKEIGSKSIWHGGNSNLKGAS